MLRTVRIRHLAIIDDLSAEFRPGLNLLTGETGAGKSILIDAMGLGLGARADRSLVRAGCDRALVELQFDVGRAPGVPSWLAGQGFDDLDPEEPLVIRREIPATGSGRAWLNGSPCALSMLRELGSRLLEVHGQHEHQSLLSPDRHLALIDQAGGHGERLEALTLEFEAVLRGQKRLEALEERARAVDERSRELQRTVDEIAAVAPVRGELAEIDRERGLLRHAAEVTGLLDEVVESTYEGEEALAARAAETARKAERLAELDPGLGELATRLRAASIELQDAGEAFRDYRERSDFDPSRLERLEQRRVALESLLLRYGCDEDEVLRREKQARRELDSLADLEEERGQARSDLDRAGERYVAAAEALSGARRESAARLVPAVGRQFKALALRKARLEVEFREVSANRCIERDGRRVPLHPEGVERAEFLLAANPGEPFRRLAKVVSGGELSRVMLALHAVIDGAAPGRALVFDEVDAGIGGAVADAVGNRLARLAGGQQVLCVTHLPQVAAYADHHLVVIKHAARGRTTVELRELAGNERIEELARMLGGKGPTPASRRHAADLLGAAARSEGRRTRRRA